MEHMKDLLEGGKRTILFKTDPRTKIKILLQEILEEKADVISNIREIISLWVEGKLEKNALFYSFFGIEQETDIFPKGQAKENYSFDFMEKLEQEEAHYIYKIKDSLRSLCRQTFEFIDAL